MKEKLEKYSCNSFRKMFSYTFAAAFEQQLFIDGSLIASIFSETLPWNSEHITRNMLLSSTTKILLIVWAQLFFRNRSPCISLCPFLGCSCTTNLRYLKANLIKILETLLEFCLRCCKKTVNNVQFFAGVLLKKFLRFF